jgi:hypothetical protein
MLQSRDHASAGASRVASIFRGGGAPLWFAAISAWFATSAGVARGHDAENLRLLAHSEKNAGRVVAMHLVEAYRAIGVTTAHPQIGLAREWGESFCARASSAFTWDHSWSLIVYADRGEQPAHSCRIPTTPNRLNAQ